MVMIVNDGKKEASWGYQSFTLRAFPSQGAEFFWPSNPSNQFQTGTSPRNCMANSFSLKGFLTLQK